MDGKGRHICVVGVQWGDEGKGKVVDYLSAECDVVVRFQGGANAGHTVKISGQAYVFHLIPSGILQDGKICVIGNGVVVDPKTVIAELDGLEAKGIHHEENLWISDRAHVVLPYHRTLDAVREKASGTGKIGTTLRGIGPCYTDKASRCGIRMGDLLDRDRFADLLRVNLVSKNLELARLHGETALDFQPIFDEYCVYADRLRPRVRDISDLLWEADRKGSRILFEGAQGSLLDIDLGTYPFVTSSSTSFLGLGPGTGFSPRRVGTVLGISKAYATRVGSGPMPTEIGGDLEEYLRKAGGEYGATTGRPRRCGWLDLPALRYTLRFGDVDALVITKLDVLSGLPTLKACTGYILKGQSVEGFPTRLDDAIQPLYEDLPGWKEPLKDCRAFGDLPREARDYLQFIADRSGRPIAMVSVGPEREAIMRLDPPLAPRGCGGSSCHG